MASALTGTAYFNGKRATVGGFLKAVESHPDLFRCKDSIIVSFGGSKYVEDAKAAHIVRVWGSSGTTRRRIPTEVLPGHHQMPGRSWRAGKAHRP